MINSFIRVTKMREVEVTQKVGANIKRVEFPCHP